MISFREAAPNHSGMLPPKLTPAAARPSLILRRQRLIREHWLADAGV